jgi:hypothetical protein
VAYSKRLIKEEVEKEVDEGGLLSLTLWLLIISAKGANDNVAKCTCGNAHSASSCKLYGAGERLLPYSIAGTEYIVAILTSPSLILYGVTVPTEHKGPVPVHWPTTLLINGTRPLAN